MSIAVRDALQQLAKPWHKPRALRIFRDNSSLSATESLWPSIQAAMDTSRYFILLASPQAATSPWVAREVTHWLAHNPPGTLLIAVTSGELHWNPTTGDYDPTRTNCLPPPLYGRGGHEPRWVDLRDLPPDQLTLRNTTFRDRIADLAAPLHGLNKDDLVGTDIRQHQRTQRLIRATIAGLTTLAVVASVSAGIAVSRFVTAAREQARAEAERERAQAEQALAEELQRDILIRQLLSEAEVLHGDGDVQAAARLSLAALHLRDDAQTRAGLLGVTIGSPITAVFSGLAEGYGLAFSPDGGTLAVSGLLASEEPTGEAGPPGPSGTESPGAGDAESAGAGGVQLWDIRDQYRPRRLGEPLTGHTDRIWHVAFSPDGSLLATAGLDGQVILWDVTDPAAPRQIGGPLTGHSAGVAAALFTPDRSVLVTAGLDDNRIILWDIQDPTDPEPIGEPLVHDDQVWSAALSPDGRLLAAGGRDGAVTLWDIQDQAVPQRLAELPTAHTGGVLAVAFRPDGNWLATGGVDGLLKLWDITTPTNLTLTDEYDHVNRIGSIAFDPDGAQLLVGGLGRALTIIDVFNEVWDDALAPASLITDTFALPQAQAEVAMYRVAYSPDGESIAAVAVDGRAAVWDRDRALLEAEAAPYYGAIALPDPAGRTVVVGGADGTVARWSMTEPADAQQLSGPVRAHDDSVVTIAFSPDGALMATVGFQDTLRLWDITDPAQLSPVGEPIEIDDVRSIVFLAGGTIMAAASTRSGVLLWDLTNPANPQALAPLNSDPEALAWTLAYVPERNLLAVGGLLDRTTLWDVTDPRQPQRLGEPLPRRRSGTYELTFSPDGSILAAGDQDGSIVLWDVTDPVAPAPIGRPIHLHADTVQSIVFSPDGTLLATGGFDIAFAVLDLSYPAQPVQIARGLAGPALAFSPLGPTIITAGLINSPVEFFDYTMANSHREHLAERACAIAGQGLTEQEWEDALPSIPYADTCPPL